MSPRSRFAVRRRAGGSDRIIAVYVFVGVDALAETKPEIFDRFVYVGATRAATYLGMVCEGSLPERLHPLRTLFVAKWG